MLLRRIVAIRDKCRLRAGAVESELLVRPTANEQADLPASGWRNHISAVARAIARRDGIAQPLGAVVERVCGDIVDPTLGTRAKIAQDERRAELGPPGTRRVTHGTRPAAGRCGVRLRRAGARRRVTCGAVRSAAVHRLQQVRDPRSRLACCAKRTHARNVRHLSTGEIDDRERCFWLLGRSTLLSASTLVLAHRRVRQRERESAVRRDLSGGRGVRRVPRAGNHLWPANEAALNAILG